MRHLHSMPDKPFLALGCLLAGLALLLSCAGTGALSYRGEQANPESVLRLVAGDVRNVTWQTNDLVIDTTYAWGDDQLDLAGQVRLQSRLSHYPVVDFLRVYVHPIDTDGVILASYPLWYAGTGRAHYFIDWSFERHYRVPDTTRAITFSYRGRMRDGGGRVPWQSREDDAVTWDFWHAP